MITLDTILVAHDFSTSADAALEYGRALAAAFRASLHVLHVVNQPFREAWSGYTPGAEFIEMVESLRVDARERLQELLSQEVDRGRAIVATSWGDPSDEILKYVQSHNMGLVVCGTHGRRGWDRILMGSVAERVVRFAACPMLTVQGGGTMSRAA